jgi:DNA-binding transcriptional LysR family regulator
MRASLTDRTTRDKAAKSNPMHSKLSLSFNHLQHFLAIADQGSLRAAADFVGLSQPAISKSLRSLESALGAPLVNRNARGSTLTPFGELLYSRARLIGNELERVNRDIRELGGIGKAKVAIGASAIPSLLLIPEAVMRFRQQYDDVGLDLVGGMPSVLLPRLQDGSLDLVVGPRPIGPIPQQIEATPLFKVPSSIIVRRGHRFQRAKSVRDLVDGEWVLSSNVAHTESALHAAFAQNGLPKAKVVVRVESLLAAYSFVASTQYVGLLPRYSRSESLILRNISYIDIPELKVVDSYELFVRRGNALSAAASKLVTQIKEQARSLKKDNRLKVS